MFEEFSSGYYLGRLYVEPHDGDCAVMQRSQHDLVNEQLYAPHDDVDLPLVMKVGQRHFPVHARDGIPQDTLALPQPLLGSCRIRNPPELVEVLLAKADRAAQLLEFSEDPTVGT